MNSRNQNKSYLDLADKKITVKDHVFTWSNLISATRLLIAFPVVIIHYQQGFQVTWLITVLVIYGILSDYLDGYIARKTGNVSEIGKLLDPVADKLTAFVLFLYTVWIGLIPVWFLAVEVVRDAIILLGSAYIKFRNDKVAMAVTSGKVSVNALALYWISAFFFPDALALQNFFMGASLVLMIYSFFDYLQRFSLIRKGMEFS